VSVIHKFFLPAHVDEAKIRGLICVRLETVIKWRCDWCVDYSVKYSVANCGII